MARCYRENKLISLADIKEKLYPIDNTVDEYITKSGKIYTWYHDDMYYPKKIFVNKKNGYVYTNIRIKEKEGFKIKNRRVHILLAKTFINNPNPKINNIVGHKDNNKQNNNLENLYWTTNQENTQKAVNDKLNVSKKGVDNSKSICVAVYENDYLVGVYGSISECGRCIEGINKGAIARCVQKDYKTRTRKYKYTSCTKEFYNQHKNIQGIHLIENQKNVKQMRQFIISNDKLGIYLLMDNQKKASEITDISQGIISGILKTGRTTYNDWKFKTIKDIEYKDSSAYKNLINTSDGYLIKNIYTGEIKQFETAKLLKEELGLNGHDISQYCKTGQTLLSEWKVYKVAKCKDEKIAA